MKAVSGLRIVLVASTVVTFALVLGSGCRDATQVTIDIALAKSALCTETNGTAITVGIDPASTEDRVAHEYVTATTSSCDPGTREIGTLVLTPSGSGRASVIVVVAYDKVTAASCKPPLFKGCIVARRQFSFTDHRHLQMPISIDPDCRDVPCDAFSTCRSGKCFSSEAACNADACGQPGDPGDGGTAIDGQVTPGTGTPVDGSTEGGETDGSSGLDSGADGASDAPADGPPSITRCNPPGGPGTLVCANVSCSGSTKYCCGATAETATCSTTPCAMAVPRYCCDGTDCGGAACSVASVASGGAVGGGIGVCGGGSTPPPPPPPPAPAPPAP
jgi:hypothetical protein